MKYFKHIKHLGEHQTKEPTSIFSCLLLEDLMVWQCVRGLIEVALSPQTTTFYVYFN